MLSLEAKAMEEYESNKKKLFSCAMRGEWDKVIEMYKQDVRLHNARIPSTRETVLHIALSDRKKYVVMEMLVVMLHKQPDKEEFVKALRTPDHRNNTALHSAASMGNAAICYSIASVEPTLVDDRNDDGETPLFLAALHGRKQAFLCLHGIRNPNMSTTTPPFYDNCRRNNGDTILHCAIIDDYFDLAFQIIHLYKDLAHGVNEEGLSPLHLLASKPLAFRSGSGLGWMETIIYRCICVEKLKVENPPFTYEYQSFRSAYWESYSHDCPDNYDTLWDVFRLIRKVIFIVCKPVDEADVENPRARGSRVDGVAHQANPLFPPNYKTFCDLIKFIFLLLLIILGKVSGGYEKLRKIYQKKETHTWSVQIVKQLLHNASMYEYEDDGRNPQEDEGYNTTSQDATLPTSIKPVSTKVKEDEQPPKKRSNESFIFTAVKNGVLEIIEKTLELFPVAINYRNEDKKSIVLLAVEHRQPHVYVFLLKKNIYKENLFHQVDKHGNSALHWAATLDVRKPWLISGEALQMQWELKWYEFVKKSMPAGFVRPYNYNHETPDEIFTRTHSELVKSGGECIRKTSESCSVVAALVATVAFATSTTLPGGVDQDSGYPTLENETAFNVFATSSLIALCCSVMAVVTFLSLLTSRFQVQDFCRKLPIKLLIGLTLLLMSITFMLVSFCAGHFFVLKHRLHHAGFTLYALTCLFVTFYVLSQFPLYFDFLRTTFVLVPQRGHQVMN